MGVDVKIRMLAGRGGGCGGVGGTKIEKYEQGRGGGREGGGVPNSGQFFDTIIIECPMPHKKLCVENHILNIYSAK